LDVYFIKQQVFGGFSILEVDVIESDKACNFIDGLAHIATNKNYSQFICFE